MSLPARLLGANPSVQVSTLLSGWFYTPSAKQAFLQPGFHSIATVSGDGSSASVTFSNIPSGFKHLQIRYTAKTTRTAYSYEGFYIYFNGAGSSGLYSTLTTYAQGSSGLNSPTTYDAQNYAYLPWGAGSLSSIANYTGMGLVEILDYSNQDKYKAIMASGGIIDFASGNGSLTSFHQSTFASTNPITSITILTNGGITTTSKFALYGRV